MNTEPREYTAEEIREKFLKRIWTMIDYWENQNCPSKYKLEGLVHTMLSTLDGATMELPGFAILPMPHETDKEYYIARGENWFPSIGSQDLTNDIGPLHEQLFLFKPKN